MLQKTYFLLILLLWAALISTSHAQESSTDSVGSKKNDKKISFAPVPYISYDRSIDFTFGAIPMVIFSINQKDTISPKSLVGVMVIYSTSKTWVGMIFSKMYFNEDRYRVKVAGGLASVNFQYYQDDPVNPGFINYNTGMDFFFAELQRNIVNKLYGGLNFTYAKLLTTYDIPGTEQDLSNLYGLGAIFSYDIRDDVYYPHQGSITNLKYNSYPGFMGNDLVSNKIEIDFNQFFGMPNKRDVVTIRFFGGAGIGDLDFNQQYGVGKNDIRGYTQGVYRGDQKLAVQAEYRWNPLEKIGFVGFAGLATIFSGPNPEHDGKLLPAAGVGFRYNVFPENHMNVGLDAAIADDDWGIYFRIGEAF